VNAGGTSTVSGRGIAWTTAVAVIAVIGSWLLVTPPNAGPDESGHIVRGIAVIEGTPGSARVDAPAWVVFPDIGCYALYSDRPASCAAVGAEPDVEIALVTRAWDYPIWGHLLPGLAVEASGPSTSPYLPRAASALLPALLVIGGLIAARRRSPLAGGLSLLALTPMAWFTFAVVNPSGLALGGAFAVWSTLLFVPWLAGAVHGAWSSRHEWLFAAGLSAAMLPRRDSIFWAAAVLVAGCIATDTSVLERVRRLRTGPLVLIVVASLAAAWWAVDNGRQTLGLFGLAALLVVGHDVWRRLRHGATTGRRLLVDGAAVASSIAVAIGLAVTRDGGYDAELLDTIVGETGSNLLEAVGALGTLDARIPLWTFLLYVGVVISIGVVSLVGADDRGERRPAWTGVGVLVVAMVAAWVLEMARGNTTGTYWQGRYSLPLLMGVPMLFGLPLLDRLGRLPVQRVARALAAVAASVSIVVFVVAVRRWGVGTAGSWNPRSWDTYGAPVSTTLLILVHAAGAAALAWAVTTRLASDHDAPMGHAEASIDGTAHGGGTSVAADADR